MLDGEMLVWSDELKGFREFGNNRSFAISENASENFCYIAFDILHYNGNDLTVKALYDRQRYLQKIVEHEDHVIEVVKSTPVVSEQDIYERLDQAILNREEGVMLKNIESLYVPGERKLNWLKFKPDHVDGLGETLDLLIMGGYYGTKFGTKSITHFLLGIAVPPADPKQTNPDTFYTFCKVGSGYNADELKLLQAALQPHWKKYDKSMQIPLFSGWQPGVGEIPDVYIEPKNSKILEVKGFQINETTKFKTEYTLRFPRVRRIRDDKEWYECTDLKVLKDLMKSNKKRKLADMKSDEIKSDKSSKLQERAQKDEKKKRKEMTTISHCLDTDVTGVVEESQLFKGKLFSKCSC